MRFYSVDAPLKMLQLKTDTSYYIQRLFQHGYYNKVMWHNITTYRHTTLMTRKKT